MEKLEIEKYKDIAIRRMWWIAIPLLLTLLAGLTYTLVVPKIYEAETLILVQPQEVPQDFVRPIVSSDIKDRLRTIKQQVTSRTNLEKIIQEHQLFDNPVESALLLDQRVELVKRNINIGMAGGWERGPSAFTISFRGKDPEKVMEVTNALASNFISENLKIRESQALGTSTFLADELESVKKRLIEKEAQLKNYREKYMGGLPEQLDTNLRILERLQGQVEQLNSNLRDAENRKLIIQKEIADAERSRPTADPSLLPQDQEPGDLVSLKNKLAALEANYTQRHPDVIKLKKRIAELEAEEPSIGSDSTKEELSTARVDQRLIRNLQDVELQTNNFRAEIEKLNSQIESYQIKVEETPKREQELLSLKRDYDNLRELYNSLLNRKLEAEIALSMEKKQKAEQFRIIDPAKIPSIPVEPNVKRIIFLTLAFGLGLGGGLAYLAEIMDTSFKAPEEMEEELQLPVLVSMPIRHTQRELRRIKWKKILAFTSVAVGFVLSAVGIVLATKGVDKTLNFVANILSNV
jgi:polysaccharide chain length determinant protein (PEP-CTERM system associated)